MIALIMLSVLVFAAVFVGCGYVIGFNKGVGFAETRRKDEP